jgi:hypothetical protein
LAAAEKPVAPDDLETVALAEAGVWRAAPGCRIYHRNAC